MNRNERALNGRLRDGFEVDWNCRGRRYHNWGPGVGRYIKTIVNRRSRRDAKLRLAGTPD